MPKHSKGANAGHRPEPRQAAQHDSKWTSEEYRFGPFVLRTDRRELRCDDMIRPMERRCFDLLVYLLRHAGRVVSKEELLDHVWASRFVTMSVIAQSVLKVRKALRLPTGLEGPLRTVHRVGYRIAGDVMHRRLAPAELQARSTANAWTWQTPLLRDMPEAPTWLPPALGAFGAWALHNHGIAVRDTPVVGSAFPTPQVRCEVAPSPQGFSARVDLYIDPSEPVRLQATSASPFQAVWQAAESAAWLVRLRDLMSGSDREPEELRWERLAALSHATPPVLGTREPVLSEVWDAQFGHSPLDQQSDLAMEAAWRGDPAATELATRLAAAAQHEKNAPAQGWAELCMAMVQWQHARAKGPEVSACVHRGMSLLAQGEPGVHSMRAAAIAGHVLCASNAMFDAPAWWRSLATQDLSTHSSAWRWRLLAELQWRLCRDDGADLAGAERLDTWVQASTMTDGLQALLLNQCGLLRAEDGELDHAWQRLKRASDIGQRCAWSSIRVLCVLSLGELSARLGDRSTLDACIVLMESGADRDGPRNMAVRDWLVARRLRLDEQYHAALGLIEHAWPLLQGCGLWFREDAWLMAIDTALHVRSRNSLVHWRQRLGASDGDRGRARSATLAAIDASIAQLDGERSRARQLMVQAWRGAPPSTAKRLLAMAAASALRWVPNESGELLTQALSQAGPWLHQSPSGRRLRDASTYRAPAVAGYGVAEPDLDMVWLWAA